MLLVWICLSWLSGLFLATASQLATWQWTVLAGVAVLSAVVFRKSEVYRMLFAFLCVGFMGASRWTSCQSEIKPDHVAFYANIPYKVVLTGQLSSDPEVDDQVIFLDLEVERVWIPALQIQKAIDGTVLVLASPQEEYRYGERIKAKGLLELPPDQGDFSYREYLARQGIHAWMPDPRIQSLGLGRANPLYQGLYTLRNNAQDQIHRIFPNSEAALLSGILLGIERFIPDELEHAYSSTGTTHIIVISGFNITIMAGLAITIFGRTLGRRWGMVFASLLILMYTLLVGADAPVVRAAIMGMITLLARYLGRATHGLTSLSAAVLIMTVINPMSILDVGFQLSFFATLGLILYAEPLTRIAVTTLKRFFPQHDVKRWGQVLGEVLLFTLAAQITTLPLIAWHFQKISLISLLANATILPLQPFVMILSGLATMLALVWQPIGQVVAWLAWPFPALTNRLVSIFAEIPGGVLYTGRLKFGWLALYYAILLLTTQLPLKSWRERLSPHLPTFPSMPEMIRTSTIYGMLTLLCLLSWTSYSQHPDGYLHLTVLNVGVGEAILIQTPSGGTVLINGGASPMKLGGELSRYLPYPNRRLDWLVIGGSQYEQIAGLREVATMVQIENVLSLEMGHGKIYAKLIKQLLEDEIPVAKAEQGARLDLGGGAFIEIVSSGRHGITMLLRYGRARVFIPIGLSPDEISQLIQHWETHNVTAVLLADGGASPVNPDLLLAHYNPRLVLISSQSSQTQTFTSESSPLHGKTILCTTHHGSIKLTSDGLTLWVTTEFKPTLFD